MLAGGGNACATAAHAWWLSFAKMAVNHRLGQLSSAATSKWKCWRRWNQRYIIYIYLYFLHNWRYRMCHSLQKYMSDSNILVSPFYFILVTWLILGTFLASKFVHRILQLLFRLWIKNTCCILTKAMTVILCKKAEHWYYRLIKKTRFSIPIAQCDRNWKFRVFHYITPRRIDREIFVYSPLW